MHKLTEKQFTWVGVRGRALAEAWQDCETLLVGKSWLGGMKAKVHISLFGADLTLVFPCLNYYKAP
jgi:hypothetical protein